MPTSSSSDRQTEFLLDHTHTEASLQGWPDYQVCLLESKIMHVPITCWFVIEHLLS